MENKCKIPYGVINWAMFVHECPFVDDFSTVQVGTLAEIERNFFENVKPISL